MLSLNSIQQQIEKLGVPLIKGKHYWYLYTILMNDMPVAKPGKTSVLLDKRIGNYLNKEHYHQSKDVSTFNLLAVLEFKTPKQQSNFEDSLKKISRKSITVFKSQPSQLEQYQLTSFWTIFNEQKHLAPNINIWLNPDSDAIIQQLVQKQTVAYNSMNYPSKTTTYAPTIISQPIDTISQPIDIISQPIDTIKPIDTISQPKDTIKPIDTISQPKDIIKPIDTISQQKENDKITYFNNNIDKIIQIKGIGQTTIEVYKIILEDGPIKNVDDFITRIKSYNKIHGKNIRFSILAKWFSS